MAILTLDEVMGKRSKYGNRKVEADGYVFDSQAEYQRWLELCDLRAAGEIIMLEAPHPLYILQIAFKDNQGHHQRAITYEGDFAYVENGKQIVEDVKGVETEVFKLKAKLFRYKYRNIELRIIKAGRR